MNNTHIVQSIRAFRSKGVVNTDYDKVEVVLYLDRKKHRKLIEGFAKLADEEIGGVENGTMLCFKSQK